MDVRGLVAVLENRGGYTPEVYMLCEVLLKARKVQKEVKKEYAREFHKERFLAYFRVDGHWTETEIDLSSYFLTEKEMKACFIEAKNEYKTDREGRTHSLPMG